MLMPTVHSFSDGLLQSLTALFTVGAVHIGGPADTGIDIAVGAIWVVIVALQIAYLPALYGAFSRREGLVSLLESRAGTPAWGPELLARHQLVGITDTLPDLYAAWEEWAADVAESHTTYPILLLFRSPEPWFSWLLGLLAVLDGAAMHLALAPEHCVVAGTAVPAHGIHPAAADGHDPGLDRSTPTRAPRARSDLTYEEFASAVQMLERVGFPTERTAEEAWPDFRGWRVNYESIAYRLADRLTAPPTPWSGPRRHLRSGTGRTPPAASTKPRGRGADVYQRPQVVIPERRRRWSRQ